MSTDKNYSLSVGRNTGRQMQAMVLILDGNSEHIACAQRKIDFFEKKKIFDYSHANQMP